MISHLARDVVVLQSSRECQLAATGNCSDAVVLVLARMEVTVVDEASLVPGRVRAKVT